MKRKGRTAPSLRSLVLRRWFQLRVERGGNQPLDGRRPAHEPILEPEIVDPLQ